MHVVFAGAAMKSLVQPGYKQTVVGVIPEDWDLQVVGGVTTTVASGRSHVNSHFGDYPVYGSTGIIGRSTNRDYEGKAILIARVGANAGKLAVVDGEYGVTDNTIMVKIASSVCMDYFWRQLEAKRLNTMVFGSGQPLITGTQIKNLVIPLPPTKAEQEAIAEALSDTDALIESLEQLITKKRHLKQGAMQELLTGKKRLPGFRAEWEVKRLGELFEITSSKRVFQSEWTTRGIPFYRARELAVLGEQGSVDNELFITKELYASCKKAYGVPAIGDILVTGVGTLGKVYVVEGESEFYFKDGNIIWFKCAGKISSEFLKQLYSTPLIIKQIEDGSEGTTVGTYTITNAKNTVIPFPALHEQTAIATILSDMDTEIAALETKLGKTRQLKQGMMHNLLTGRIRLIKPTIATMQLHASNSTECPAAPKLDKPHTWAFNEAVVISVLADQFAKPEFPLGRKRYTKLSYLMHRMTEQAADGYLKKAAGPYNPKTKYAGPERIALENGYIREHQNGKFRGFVAAEKIEQAKAYFSKWYGVNIGAWLEQFRRRSNDDLERLATVDMAMQDLLRQGKVVDVASVRALIASEPEWLPKLERTVFSDAGIAAAIAECQIVFGC